MKTCEDVVNDLLERRRQYRLQQRKRRNTRIKLISSASCLCLAALLGAGLWCGGAQNQPLPPESPPISSAAKNRIRVNRMDSRTGDTARLKININLSWDDFVPLDAVELREYYGTNIFPWVPEDLDNWENEEDFDGYGIFRRDRGRGEVYWDQTVLNYSNPDFTRSVNLEVAKGRLPFVCFAMDKEYEKSDICGTQVYLGLTDAGYYHAQFLYEGTGFILTARGLSEGEVIAVLESLVQSN